MIFKATLVSTFIGFSRLDKIINESVISPPVSQMRKEAVRMTTETEVFRGLVQDFGSQLLSDGANSLLLSPNSFSLAKFTQACFYKQYLAGHKGIDLEKNLFS